MTRRDIVFKVYDNNELDEVIEYLKLPEKKYSKNNPNKNYPRFLGTRKDSSMVDTCDLYHGEKSDQYNIFNWNNYIYNIGKIKIIESNKLYSKLGMEDINDTWRI